MLVINGLTLTESRLFPAAGINNSTFSLGQESHPHASRLPSWITSSDSDHLWWEGPHLRVVSVNMLRNTHSPFTECFLLHSDLYWMTCHGLCQLQLTAVAAGSASRQNSQGWKKPWSSGNIFQEKCKSAIVITSVCLLFNLRDNKFRGPTTLWLHFACLNSAKTFYATCPVSSGFCLTKCATTPLQIGIWRMSKRACPFLFPKDIARTLFCL